MSRAIGIFCVTISIMGLLTDIFAKHYKFRLQHGDTAAGSVTFNHAAGRLACDKSICQRLASPPHPIFKMFSIFAFF